MWTVSIKEVFSPESVWNGGTINLGRDLNLPDWKGEGKLLNKKGKNSQKVTLCNIKKVTGIV